MQARRLLVFGRELGAELFFLREHVLEFLFPLPVLLAQPRELLHGLVVVAEGWRAVPNEQVAAAKVVGGLVGMHAWRTGPSAIGRVLKALDLSSVRVHGCMCLRACASGSCSRSLPCTLYVGAWRAGWSTPSRCDRPIAYLGQQRLDLLGLLAHLHVEVRHLEHLCASAKLRQETRQGVDLV